MAYDVFNYVIDKAHAEAFGEPRLWGSGLPKDKRHGEHGHVGTRSCQFVLPGTTRHRDRDVVLVSQLEEVKVGLRLPGAAFNKTAASEVQVCKGQSSAAV